MKCVSCNNDHHEKFCPNCGEKSGTNRITLSSMSTDVFSTVTNMDKGFLYNLKSLSLYPQKLFKDYINGRRKGILNPISYLIYGVSFYLIAIVVFDVPEELKSTKEVERHHLQQIGYDIGYFIRGYLKYFWIMTIFPLALALKLAYSKYNFVEHLAISSFMIGHASLFAVFSYYTLGLPLMFDPIVYLVICYMVFKLLRDHRSRGDSLFWVFTILLLFVTQLLIMFVLIAVCRAYF